ncbi:hypothetical protein [Clostridium sp. YIM B02500]|uniref:hypothetical protein n=1 Tax=Clostridium sp. YIM B02500 TaxID=2910681 RepID=UPI001EED7CA5|nr:hypothetical protein [Clostridium sp. YIM B02500]
MDNCVNVNRKSIIKIIWTVSLVFLIIQVWIEKFLGLKLLLFSIDANFIKLLIILFLLLSPIISFNYKKHKVIKIIYLVLAVICSIYISIIYLFAFSSDVCFYSRSPYDSKRELVIEETSFLMGGAGYFYERKYIIFMKQIHGTITYEVPPSFSRGEATIKWLDENTVQVDYINNSSGHHDIEIVKIP